MVSPGTIQDLMLFMCTSRFDLKEEQRAMINEYLSYEEVQADREEKDTKASELDPISDNEEDDEGDLIQIRLRQIRKISMDVLFTIRTSIILASLPQCRP